MARIIEITDFAAPELDVYARATENQLVNRADPANALFIAESPLVIGRALDAGWSRSISPARARRSCTAVTRTFPSTPRRWMY